MPRSILLVAGLTTLLGACCPTPKTETAPTMSVSDPVDSAPTPTPTPTPYQHAQAEVARLTALADQDPLLAPWAGPYGGVPPWDQLDPSKFAAAFTTGLALRAAELDAIVTNPAPPTFANTLAALEDAGRHLHRVETLFGVMTSGLNSPAVQAVDEVWSPKLAVAADQQLRFNQALFDRVAVVYADRAGAGLTPMQDRIVERTYQAMVRGGAKLDAAGKAQLGKVNEELAGLYTSFGNKVLADEDTWIVLDDKAQLAGLPADLVASYQAAAEERKLPGKWAVVNTRSSVDPFLAASSRRDLRERVWTAFKARGDHGDDHDTKATIARIVKLRAERAALLGYPSHAHLRMDDTMAHDPAKATELMMRVWPAAVARVHEEVADMQKLVDTDRTLGKGKHRLEPWDYLYYAEKVKQAKYKFDTDQLKPYFALDNMIKASMYMAERLYGLTFVEVTGQVPVFHPDVRVWEVHAKASGQVVGLFYGDYFARAGKRSGAWMSSYQVFEAFTGATRIPIVSNNNNFVRGAADAPVLISLDDAQTLFHEFGHAIHYLLAETPYPSLGDTPSDFVEYPSQVHEMWVLSRPILDQFARHVQTGQPMPQALVDKVEASSKFNQGYQTVEYLAAAIVDMKLHTIADGVIDPARFERDTLAAIGAPREVAMRHRLPQFNHLFTSDEYSAGYYSYLWSDVMAADTIAAFKDAGDVFDPAVAGKLRAYILAPGNATDRAEAYRQFRGRDPDVKALLAKRGFPVK
ncbi:MAG: M3 family metallopeptidase [Kofleriaceae bacterium]